LCRSSRPPPVGRLAWVSTHGPSSLPPCCHARQRRPRPRWRRPFSFHKRPLILVVREWGKRKRACFRQKICFVMGSLSDNILKPHLSHRGVDIGPRQTDRDYSCASAHHATRRVRPVERDQAPPPYSPRVRTRPGTVARAPDVSS